MVKGNADAPENKRVIYRIGINLGDVLIDGDDIFGDGVNLARGLKGFATTAGSYFRRRFRSRAWRAFR